MAEVLNYVAAITTIVEWGVQCISRPLMDILDLRNSSQEQFQFELDNLRAVLESLKEIEAEEPYGHPKCAHIYDLIKIRAEQCVKDIEGFKSKNGKGGLKGLVRRFLLKKKVDEFLGKTERQKTSLLILIAITQIMLGRTAPYVATSRPVNSGLQIQSESDNYKKWKASWSLDSTGEREHRPSVGTRFSPDTHDPPKYRRKNQADKERKSQHNREEFHTKIPDKSRFLDLILENAVTSKGYVSSIISMLARCSSKVHIQRQQPSTACKQYPAHARGSSKIASVGDSCCKGILFANEKTAQFGGLIDPTGIELRVELVSLAGFGACD